MDGDMEISLDKLPIKRLDVIEENGAERFPSDVDYDEKRVSLIRRIDFAWAVEEDDAKKKNKKQKNSSKESTGPWQWQGMVENLQLAHQELSLIINLIDTVEANDSVTVAGMTRPKPLPNELLSDLAVSTATKLQNYRNLGKYFKQSAKALEQQINREARFYGALIRLQRNWKVKRQRVAASTHVNDGFTFDLFDSSLYDSTFVIRPSSLSTIRVDHDSAGMLSINLPQESCHSLCFGFLGLHSTDDLKESNNKEDLSLVDDIPGKLDKHPASDGESVKETHLLLREVHKSIFAEQLFDMVNREAFNQSAGVYLTGIRENYLEISIGQGASLFISLVPSSKVNAPKNLASSDTSNAIAPAEEKLERPSKKPGFPSRNSCEIYLQRIFHEHVFRNRKDQFKLNSTHVPSKPEKDDSGILGHFCMSLAHRIYSKRVLLELENVVSRVPYLHLMSHPTWNSRKSSSTVFVNVPPIAHQGYSDSQTEADGKKNVVKSQFRTIVSVNDDCITVEGECSPNVVGLFKGSSHDLYSMNSYNCDLADLPVVILQQVASQTICWLHEEARTVGAKVNQDFLSLSFEIEQGETVSLVAHVDPEDVHGGISWWLVVGDNNAVEGRKYQAGLSQSVSDNKKFLGHLSLELLYAAVMDLVSFCGGPTEQER